MQRAGSNDNKVGVLLDYLPLGGPNAFDSFVKALKETDQEHAADILIEAAEDNQQPQASTSSCAADGNIIYM